MWCSTCQRDSAATALAESGGFNRCAQCGTRLRYDAEAASAGQDLSPETTAKPLNKPRVPDDDWELEADVRAVHRLVEKLQVESQQGAARTDWPEALLGPHDQHSAWTPAAALLEPPAEPTAAPTAEPKTNLAAWSLLSVGLATLTCGAVLLGWSLAAGRDDLWSLGMPLAIVGQASLILGLVLQLDGLWNTSRRTEKALTTLDHRLARLREATIREANMRAATTRLSLRERGPARSLYAHMAEEATPPPSLAAVADPASVRG